VASDGEYAPAELVRRAFEAGLRTIGVTDHDTTGGLAEAAAAAAERGMRFLPGIELSCVSGGRDVHVLAYGFAGDSSTIAAFLRDQREHRVQRVFEMADRLAALGLPVDVGPVVALARSSGQASVGRPQLALALVDAGHVPSVAEAFDRYLHEGGPAYVPHRPVSPLEAVDMVRRARGVTSLAHPGLLGRDEIIPQLVEAGLLALEAWHSDHDEATTARYAALAARLGLGVTGGSDFHGERVGRSRRLGEITLPEGVFEDFLERAGAAGAMNLPGRHSRPT
jgi:hypothetical protein